MLIHSPHRLRRFIDLRRARGPAALVLLLGLGGMAQAAQDSPVTVDRIYRTEEYVTVVVRVKNTSPERLPEVRVACDVFAADGTGLGVAYAKAENVPGNGTVIGEALGRMPPKDIPAKSAECRELDGY